MAVVTLTTLRARARERADMPIAGFVPESVTGIDAWINEGVQKLHEMMVKAYGEDLLETIATQNTVAGQSDYALPTDHFVFNSAKLTIGGVEITLTPYENTEASLMKNKSIFGNWNYRPYYKLTGGAAKIPPKIRLLPAPDGVYPLAIHYSPVATLLVASGDSIDYPNGWERYVVCYTAIQMMIKEESDVRELRTELDKMELELETIARRRNADRSHSAVDVESVEIDGPYNYF